MSDKLKRLLLWSLVFPTIVTILRIFIDIILGENIELLSYTALFLGTATAGLIIVGPLMYLVSKSKEEK
ncbi:hypothetical protein CWR48_16730 [Oceanobacillus arenosus]|uniref:Uncharacterized protein n=1 Tax=Oceanobacillus arenosus TaxID=1229153 RepID=A0A3D8PJM7_9BACI|nr:hypothetical protein [Oceanobacillus arenosus]RDW16293.1 hypothetical protein CWR48_16730 [Oceanobacillus arenosus]